MVPDTHLLNRNVNNSCNHQMNSVYLSDQFSNVWRVKHWMFKYNWWRSLFFWGHGLIIVNVYIIYKTFFEEGKVNTIIHYYFGIWFYWRRLTPLIFLSAIIWFLRFNAESSRRSMDLHILVLFRHGEQNKRKYNRVSRSWTWNNISQI